LLQRIESYRGLAILATNMKSALDAAFLRRLRFIVNFPFPSIADRRRLWEKVFMQEDVSRGLTAPPIDKLDYDRLARLNLTGGHIHNVALNASFMAAHAGTKVTMPLILNAAKAEYLKLDRPVNEAEFRFVAPSPIAPKPAASAGEPVPG
jgi:SpoVK/Ycf46/Vps4 family AAA+-type ATPase